jgi:hypothetical protein
MPNPESADRMHDDLAFVRRAVETSDRHSTPAAIYLLWAAISAVGFPLLDLAPERTAIYWFVASPLGLVASLWLGRRHAMRVGQVGRREGWRHGLHWLGLVLATGLTVPLIATGRIGGTALGQVILLLVALAYFLAGVHLDRAMLWVSAVLVAGYLALFVLDAWGWTVVGSTLAASLVACALLARRHDGRTAG